jgi:L-asparaginase
MRISLISTGGTIASRRDPERGLVVQDGVDDLVKLLSPPPGVEFVAVELSNRSSFSLSLADMLAGIARIRAELAAGSDGVIVTHGTDTMEEMAFLTGQLLPRDARVVLTGAQRAADAADNDAERNLRDAVQVVCSPVPIGPAIVMGGHAVAAVEGRKVHTSSLVAFSGGPAGSSALVDADQVVRLSTPSRGGRFATADLPASLPRVDLVTLVAGADATHVLGSIEAGAAGIVIEAFGSGNANLELLEAVKTAVAKGVSVVVTSRTGEGMVQPLYGNGGGADLAKAGAIFAGDLTGPRARVALALALAHVPAEDVAAVMNEMIQGVVPCAPVQS